MCAQRINGAYPDTTTDARDPIYLQSYDVTQVSVRRLRVHLEVMDENVFHVSDDTSVESIIQNVTSDKESAIADVARTIRLISPDNAS